MPTISWDAVTLDVLGGEETLGGYNVYWGTVPGTYITHLDVGNVLTYSWAGSNPEVVNYFTITCYDAAANESDASAVVSFPCRKRPYEPVKSFRHFA